MEYKLTEASKNVWNISEKIAKQLGHSYLGTEHILYGLMKNDIGVVASIVKENKINAEYIYKKIEEIIGKNSRVDRIIGQTP